MNGIHSGFSGRLGADPERRFTKTGKAMLQFSVAVDQNTFEAEDRAAPETMWVRVTAWEPTEELEGKLKKGALVYCEGRLELDRWTAKDGAERSGLSMSAWVVQPMGQIGRKSGMWDGGQPRRREPVGATAVSQGRQPAPVAQDDDFETLPF
jgi:single-strand DNA-binding protein